MIQIQDLDLKLLRVFDAVVRCGGFSAAQAELDVGQPTISAQIAQLEVRLGVRLCERGRAGFRLTEQGRGAHEAIQRLLAAIDVFRSDAETFRKASSGTLNVGVIDNTVTDAKSPLLRVVEKFLARGPHVDLHFQIGPPGDLQQQVLDGRLHVAIGHFPFGVPGLLSMPLYEEIHGLFCHARHPYAKAAWRGGQLKEQLQSARVVARGYLRRRDLDLLGVPSATSVADNLEAQVMVILAAGMVGFLPLHYAAHWVKQGQLVRIFPDQMELKSKFTAVTRRASPVPLLRDFLADLEMCSPRREQ